MNITTLARRPGAAAAAIAAVAAVGFAALAVPAPALAEDGPDVNAIGRTVTAFAASHAYPGIAVAVTRGDRILHVAGYGHDSTGARVTATTPMPVASLSKSFTALAVMQLVDAGRVRLDEPVRTYVPDFGVDDPRGDRITVRNLLNQTSGITDLTLREKSLPQPDSLIDAVTRAHQARLASEPGVRHAYTNTNYHLAARVVEAVSGEPFTDYVRGHVLEPAGMGGSIAITRTPRDLPSNVHKGHVFAYGASVAVAEPDRFVDGSDGIITTAADLARWLVVQNNGGVTAEGTRLVSTDAVTAMHTPSDPRWTYGMGWYAEDGRVDHTGIWFTYTAAQELLPHGYGIAVVGNSGVSLANEGLLPLADELAGVVTGGRPPSAAPPWRLIADLVTGALMLLGVALNVRSLRGASRWADRFAHAPVWKPTLRLLPRVVPMVLLVLLPRLVGLLYSGGRDVTLAQLALAAAPVVLWAAVAAVLNLVVLGVRVAGLARRRTAAAA